MVWYLWTLTEQLEARDGMATNACSDVTTNCGPALLLTLDMN
jgi:hypothetical protein